MDYLKYYWLEKDYLEKEVRPSFLSKRYLTAEEFFCIIRWKSPGFGKVPIKDGLLAGDKSLSLDETVCDLTKNIYKTETKEGKLKILLDQKGIQLAMASAVLTILYPDTFTVYDRHVRSQLKNPKSNKEQYPDITGTENTMRRYFDEYIPQVLQEGRKISQNPNLSLRNCDRVLWAKSWHEGLQKFLKEKI